MSGCQNCGTTTPDSNGYRRGLSGACYQYRYRTGQDRPSTPGVIYRGRPVTHRCSNCDCPTPYRGHGGAGVGGFEDVMKQLDGLGADAPIETKPNGARQSATRWRFDLIDAPALFTLARVLDYGARRYAPNNWRGLTVEEHLNHCAVHLFAFLAGDRQDDHLGHLLCRSMMALAAAQAAGYEARQADEVVDAPEARP